MGGLSLTETDWSPYLRPSLVCISLNKSIIYLKEKHFLWKERLNNLFGVAQQNVNAVAVRVPVYYFAPGPLCWVTSSGFASWLLHFLSTMAAREAAGFFQSPLFEELWGRRRLCFHRLCQWHMCLLGIQVLTKPAWDAELTKTTAIAGCWKIYGAAEPAGCRVNNTESSKSSCCTLALPLASKVIFNPKEPGFKD